MGEGRECILHRLARQTKKVVSMRENFERGYRSGFLQQVYHAALNLASTELRWDL